MASFSPEKLQLQEMSISSILVWTKDNIMIVFVKFAQVTSAFHKWLNPTKTAEWSSLQILSTQGASSKIVQGAVPAGVKFC